MANYDYIQSTGVIVPDTVNIQGEVISEFQFAFGADLITTPDTPQGVLITNEVLARASVVRNNAQLANQINPNLAGGVFLAAICALTGLTPSPGTLTVIPGVTLAGVAGTVVPLDIIVNDANGNAFQPVSSVTLNGSGTATVNFQAAPILNPVTNLPEPNYGPIVVPANTLTLIVDGVLGLETVTNPNPSIPGTLLQSDVQLRQQRNNTLALQATALAEAVISGLYTTPGVTSVFFQENVSDITQTINGVTMVPHSLYACVDGGTTLAVATTLTNTKGGGCSYNNGPGVNISQNVTVPFSNQIIDVLFDTPNYIPILVQVTVEANATVTDPVSQVQNAVLNYANGLISDEPGFGIGDDVSSFEIAGAVNQQVPGLNVQLVQTRKVSGGSFSSNPLTINVFERATVTQSAITVIIV